MKMLWVLMALTLPLTACGHKGKLVTPSEAVEREQKRLEREAKREAREALEEQKEGGEEAAAQP